MKVRITVAFSLVFCMLLCIVFSGCGETDASHSEGTRETASETAVAETTPEGKTEAKEQNAPETEKMTQTTEKETAAETPQPLPDPSTVSFPEPEAADWDALGYMNVNFNTFINVFTLPFFVNQPDGQPEDTYEIHLNSATMDSAQAEKAMFYFSTSLLYERFFGEPESAYINRDADVFRAWDNTTDDITVPGTDWGIRYPEQNIRWLAQNVLNMQQPFEPEAFAAAPGYCVYRDGYFYFPGPGYEFDPFYYTCVYLKRQNDDGTYTMSVTLVNIPAYDNQINVSGTGSITVALKEIDGVRFWSVYDYNAHFEVELIPSE